LSPTSTGRVTRAVPGCVELEDKVVVLDAVVLVEDELEDVVLDGVAVVLEAVVKVEVVV